MHFNINYTCFFFSQWSPRGLTGPINACYFKQRRGRRHGNENGKKAIDLARAFCAFLCCRCTTTTWKFLVARFVEDVCGRSDFHIYQKLSEISMKNSIEWRTCSIWRKFDSFIILLSPKLKMVAQISPWIAYNWWLFVNGTCISTGKFQQEKRATFPKFHLFPGTHGKRVSH